MRIMMTRSDVALFFDKSINCIIQAVKNQRDTALKPISVREVPVLHQDAPDIFPQHVVLVGGFSASDWVYSQVTEKLTPLGLHIIRPDNHVFVPIPFNFVLTN